MGVDAGHAFDYFESDTSLDARNVAGKPLKLWQSHPDCVRVGLDDRVIS